MHVYNATANTGAVCRCGHYFCEACALKRFAKTPRCYACNAPTGGAFAAAADLLERLAQKRKRKEEERRAVRASGDDGESGLAQDDVYANEEEEEGAV